jgi:hypothetical protein
MTTPSERLRLVTKGPNLRPAGEFGANRWQHYPTRMTRLASACLLLSVAACHVQLVSDYDDQMVKDATAVQTDVDTLLQTELNPPRETDTSYEASKPAYNKIAVNLDSLRMQAMSHPNNGPTIEQVDALAKDVADLQALHMKDNTLGRIFIQQEQNDIATHVSLIVRTENDKKAGNAGG